MNKDEIVDGIHQCEHSAGLFIRQLAWVRVYNLPEESIIKDYELIGRYADIVHHPLYSNLDRDVLELRLSEIIDFCLAAQKVVNDNPESYNGLLSHRAQVDKDLLEWNARYHAKILKGLNPNSYTDDSIDSAASSSV